MAIEFRCTQCNGLLRTDDDTAGRQAKCPQCSALVPIPAHDAAAFSPPQALDDPRNGPEALNPYRAPLAVDAPPVAIAPSGVWAPAKIDIGDVWGRTWRILKNRLLLCVLVIDVTMLFLTIVQVAISLVNARWAVADIEVQSFGEQFLIQSLFSLPASILIIVPQVWLRLGIMIFTLKVARGQEASFGDVFSGGRFFLRGLAVSLLLTVVGAAILVVCELPAVLAGRMGGNPDLAQALSFLGILVYFLCILVMWLFLSQFQALLVDRNLRALESLRVSIQITAGNKFSLFIIYLAMGLIVMVSVLACGVGLVFSVPFTMLATAVIYLRMTSQPTADQLAA